MGTWIRWVVGATLGVTATSLGFVVHLAVAEGSLETRQLSFEQRQQETQRMMEEQRLEMREDMSRRFTELDELIRESRHADRQPTSSNERVPVFGVK